MWLYQPLETKCVDLTRHLGFLVSGNGWSHSRDPTLFHHPLIIVESFPIFINLERFGLCRCSFLSVHSPVPISAG